MYNLDGIAAPPILGRKSGGVRSQPPRGRWRRRIISIGIIGLALIVAFGVWVKPILAALPLDSWSERAVASRLLRPGSYLVIFQNSRELRPTGGFLGSFAVIELGWGGQVKNFFVETNIYTRDANYANTLPPRTDFFDPRGPMPVWAMRESNWAIDFPTAAQTIAWFYEHEGGRRVDGVIALDARILERVLRLTGPIDLTEDDLYLTADNVIDALQEEIEKNYWLREGAIGDNQPKAVLKHLMDALLARFRIESLPAWLALANQALAAREIQVALRDPGLAKLLAKKQWDGHLRVAEAADFLSLNEANASGSDELTKSRGAKSSHEIERNLIVTRDVGGLRHLILKRHHHGQNVWPGGPNHSWIRAVVPSGATFIAATRNGQTINDEVVIGSESGATTFGFWSHLNPGENETLELTYQVSQSELGNWLYQHQAGVSAIQLEVWDNLSLRFSGIIDRDFELP